MNRLVTDPRQQELTLFGVTCGILGPTNMRWAGFVRFQLKWQRRRPCSMKSTVVLTQMSPKAIDSNSYILGTIDRHHIVIARLSSGHYGTNNAAIVVNNMRRTFRIMQLGFIVGIAGGVPGKADIQASFSQFLRCLNSTSSVGSSLIVFTQSTLQTALI